MLQVSRHWLYLIAGVLWTFVGLLLCGRAVGWLLLLPTETNLPLGAISILLAGLAYYFGFSKIVSKNIARIEQLPPCTPFYSFTAPRGYVLIALMMSAGILLRNSSLPKIYLTIPYLAMGGVLLIGSVRFYERFVKTRKDG